MSEPRRISKSRSDRTTGQSRVLVVDLAFVHPCRETVEHDADRDSGAANTRLAMKNLGVGNDQIESLVSHAIHGPTEQRHRPLLAVSNRHYPLKLRTG